MKSAAHYMEETMMGQYLNPGNAGFRKAVRSQIYVDKTGMLEHLNAVLDTEQGYVCVSRPAALENP